MGNRAYFHYKSVGKLYLFWFKFYIIKLYFFRSSEWLIDWINFESFSHNLLYQEVCIMIDVLVTLSLNREFQASRPAVLFIWSVSLTGKETVNNIHPIFRNAWSIYHMYTFQVQDLNSRLPLRIEEPMKNISKQALSRLYTYIMYIYSNHSCTVTQSMYWNNCSDNTMYI